MANTATNFNVDPYYDDFNESKNFHRVLFKPGQAVQARELTQMQTILQNQIERFGNHIFEEGSPVQGGDLTVDYDTNYIKLANTSTVSMFANTTIRGLLSNTEALVYSTIGAAGVDPPTLMVKVQTGDIAELFGVLSSVSSNLTSATLGTGSGLFVSSANNDYYNNMMIRTTGGTGLGQARKIADYVGSSRRVHLDSAWSVLPDTTTEFKITRKSNKFKSGETINVIANNGVAWPTSKFPNTTVATTADPFGNTCFAGVDDGVFYIRGTFVNFGKDSKVIGKYTDKPDALLGLTIAESTISSTLDTTLLDPASGSYNYAAPGADRWKISLTLETKTLAVGSNNASNNFIEIARFKQGQLQQATKYPIYSDLEKTMARRTFDESGNYVVTPFVLSKREQMVHAMGMITDATADTIRLTSNAVANDDFYNDMEMLMLSGTAQGNVRTISDYVGSTKLVTVGSDWTNTPTSADEYTIYDPAFWQASIGSGKAYVNGHEIEFAIPSAIPMPRAREYIQINNASLYSQYGNYLKIDSLQGYFNTSDHDTVYLHYVPQANVSIASGAAWKGTQMGTARIRYLQDNGTVGQGHSGRGYKAYLYNVRVSNTITGTAVASAPGSRTTLNLANNTSVPQIDDIFNGASISVTTGSAIDTVIVGDYTGSTRQITTANTLSAVPTGSTTYSIKMNAKQIRSITAVDNTTTPTKFTGSANVALVGHSGAAASGNTILFETNDNSLAMQLPEQAIKSVKDSGGGDDTSYRFQRVFEGVSFTSGVATISTGSAAERFVGTGSSDVSDSLVQDNYIVVITDSGTLPSNSSGGFIAGNNYVLDFTTNSRIVNVPTPGGAAVGTAQLTANVAYNFTGTVFASIDVGTAAPKTKTRVAANTTHAVGTSGTGQLAISSPNKLNGSYDSLQHSDVVSLVAVYDSLDPNVSVTTGQVGTAANDITVRYRLDTGQRDNFYDHGRIVLKAGYPAPTGRLLVLFDRYTHSGTGYFSVDSYSGGGASTLYKNIPDFTSPTTGNKVNLRDVIDFRPRRQDTDTDDEIFTVENGQIITPVTAIDLDYSYYIGRIDKIVLSDQRGFKVITGVSAEVPKPPKDEKNSMTMWTLELPPYTFNVQDIRVRKTDNRRFTMRDIGAIVKRVDNLEYYTSLSLLEKDASEMVITDGAGIERFKNGIIVDSFKGHGIGDVQNEDYFIAVDATKNELRPPGAVGKGVLNYYPSDTGSSARTTQTGELLTCQFTEEVVVDQSLATRTIPVNPFNTLAWVGVMKLTPERDDTPDIFTKPDIQANIEGDADAWEALAKPHNDKLSTNWGAWETNWQGTELTGTENVSRTRESRVSGGTNVTNETIKRDTFTTTRNQSRQGFIPNALVPERETVNLGERVVDVNIMPYIRSQVIAVTVDGLKPNTRVYSFFDSIAVSGFVKRTAADMANNQVAYAQPIVSNNKGSANLVFYIPGSNDTRPEYEAMKFKAGERLFMVCDDNMARKDVATTYAEATFVASGLNLTKETTMLTTRVPRVRRKDFNEARVVKDAATEESVISSSTAFRADPPPPPPNRYWDDGGDGGYSCSNESQDNPCSCTCNCSACSGDGGGDGGGCIICSTLFKLGWFDEDLHKWDEKFGDYMKANSPEIMIGYWSWAKTIIALMYGRGPSIFFWIKDEKKRFELQSRVTQKYVYTVARPWAEEMAAQMGSKDHKSNLAGKLIMKIGLPLCGFLGKRIMKRPEKAVGAGHGCTVYDLPVQYIEPSTTASRGWAMWGIGTIMIGAALITTSTRSAWRDLVGAV